MVLTGVKDPAGFKVELGELYMGKTVRRSPIRAAEAGYL